MKITLSQENGNDKIYEIKADSPMTPDAVEASGDVQNIVSGKKYEIQGDMDDPSIFWITVTG